MGCFMDWERLTTILTGTFITFASGAILAMLRMEWHIHKDVKELKRRSGHTREENIMQFRLLKALVRIIRCLTRSIRNGTKNGELEQAEEEVADIEKNIDMYLSESIH